MSERPKPGHRPGRPTHRVLRALDASPQRLSLVEMMEAAGVDPFSARGRRFPRLVSAITRDGLVASAFSNTAQASLYWITDEGQTALARLDAGEAVVIGAPSVRLFVARAAA